MDIKDHSKQISELLEATTNTRVMRERDSETTWESFITDLFGLVNSRMRVNLAILEVIAYSIMIVSAGRHNYSFPKPWTRAGFGVQARQINLRSMSAPMAFQGHTSVLTDPLSFNITNRMDHPLDVFLDPVAVLAERRRREKVNTHVTPITWDGELYGESYRA